MRLSVITTLHAKEHTPMKRFSWRLTRLFVIPVLLGLVFFLVSNHAAFALVNSQATRQFNPGKTFCLPTQQISGYNGGKVSGGGFSFGNSSGSPIDTLWTIYNGPARGNLHIISQVSSSFSVVEKTVPIGSFYRVCDTNTTNVLVSFSIQQSEVYLN
jgi:hypothetical protein